LIFISSGLSFLSRSAVVSPPVPTVSVWTLFAARLPVRVLALLAARLSVCVLALLTARLSVRVLALLTCCLSVRILALLACCLSVCVLALFACCLSVRVLALLTCCLPRFPVLTSASHLSVFSALALSVILAGFLQILLVLLFLFLQALKLLHFLSGKSRLILLAAPAPELKLVCGILLDPLFVPFFHHDLHELSEDIDALHLALQPVRRSDIVTDAGKPSV
jgi:hypothetical protein